MIQSGSDKAAVAWVIAKNNEQSSSLEKQKKAYKDGIVDTEKDLPPDIPRTQEELPPTPISPDGLEIPVDPDGRTEGYPFVGDLENGIYFDCGENTHKGVTDNYTVKISVDYSVTRTTSSLPRFSKGALKWELYSSSGMAAYDYSMSSGNWFIKEYSDESGKDLYQHVCTWVMRPSTIYIHAEHKQVGTTRLYDLDWSKTSSAISGISTGELNSIKTIWRNAKTISTLPTT